MKMSPEEPFTQMPERSQLPPQLQFESPPNPSPSPNAPGKAPNHIHTTLRWGRAPGKPSLAGACWALTEDPSGCGAASPSQGRWDPDSLRPALRLARTLAQKEAPDQLLSKSGPLL